jgi:hypothetical protein
MARGSGLRASTCLCIRAGMGIATPAVEERTTTMVATALTTAGNIIDMSDVFPELIKGRGIAGDR